MAQRRRPLSLSSWFYKRLVIVVEIIEIGKNATKKVASIQTPQLGQSFFFFLNAILCPGYFCPLKDSFAVPFSGCKIFHGRDFFP